MSATPALTLAIAGVRFRVHAEPGVEVSEASPRYQGFLGQPPDDADPIEIRVRLRLEAPPPAPPGEPLFDTGETWLAREDGGCIRLEFFPGRPQREPLWVARLPREGVAPGIELYCGAALVRRRDGRTRVESPLRYPLDQLLLARLLSVRGGILVHSAGVRRGARGVVLPGRSGAGKSTSMRLLGAGDGELARLSDDRIALRRRGSAFALYGTPWAGDEQVASPASASLAAIAFLSKAPEDALVPLAPRAALGWLLPTVSLIGWDGELSEPGYRTCRALVEAVPCYELRFRRDGDVAGLLEALL